MIENGWSTQIKIENYIKVTPEYEELRRCLGYSEANPIGGCSENHQEGAYQMYMATNMQNTAWYKLLKDLDGLEQGRFS